MRHFQIYVVKSITTSRALGNHADPIQQTNRPTSPWRFRTPLFDYKALRIQSARNRESSYCDTSVSANNIFNLADIIR
jgi:hypothetical protein